MQAYDFSFEPFVTVKEKDTYSAGTSFLNAQGQTITVATGSTVTITESRNPFFDFWVFTVCIVGFIFCVYKIQCYIKR